MYNNIICLYFVRQYASCLLGTFSSPKLIHCILV